MISCIALALFVLIFLLWLYSASFVLGLLATLLLIAWVFSFDFDL